MCTQNTCSYGIHLDEPRSGHETSPASINVLSHNSLWGKYSMNTASW